MSSIVMQPHDGYTKTADPFLTPMQQLAADDYRNLCIEADRRGWKPASLISLHPFNWPITGPIHGPDIRVPAVPLSQEQWDRSPKLKLRNGLDVPFAQYVFTMWRPSQGTYLIGTVDFTERVTASHCWPIDQARDGVHQNNLNEDRGGVFCYEGSHVPLAVNRPWDPEGKTRAQEQDLLEDAFAKQIVYYNNMYSKFSDAYMTRQTTNSWKDLVGKGKYHRWIALYLYRAGMLKEMPAWYQEISAPGQKANEKCAQCMQNVEPGSVICRHCHFVLRPFDAFAKLMIDAETPGARLAAKRLNANELKSLVNNQLISEEALADWGIELPGKDKKKLAEPKNN